MKKAELAALRASVVAAAKSLRSLGVTRLAFPEESIGVATPGQLRSWLFWAQETAKNIQSA